MKRIFFIFLFGLLVFDVTFAKDKRQESFRNVPKNVVIMIGDGMGIGSISGYYFSNTNANIIKFKNIGLMTTYADGSLITDSAAGGTAIATGYKTKNGYISMSSDGKPLETIMEVAKRKNKSTGIVVTCSITHATPAVFYSHVSSRANEKQIALFITNQVIDVAFGGGLNFFVSGVSGLNQGYSEIGESYSNLVSGEENVDLLNIIKNLNYRIITNYEDFISYSPNKFERVFALLEPLHLPSASSGNRKVSLADMTKKALEILSKSRDGFVMMVEGSQIDWEAHGNNQKGVLIEMDDFDKAVGVVLDFAIKDGNTLVIVLSDHETGGIGIVGGVFGKNAVLRFLSKDHTGEMVPVFSYGPGSEKFIGIFDNTYVGRTLIDLVSQN